MVYRDQRRLQYPALGDQLDMIYHDLVNGTTVWKNTITAIKAANPKPTTQEVSAMAIDTTYYGDVDEANAYFAARLHSQPWEEADPGEKPKAILAARRLIDNLNFKGDKHTVWLFRQETPPPWRDPYTDLPNRQSMQRYLEAERAANASQELEFPRGSDTVVPENIRIAEYELAFPSWTGSTHKWNWRTWRSRPRAMRRCGRTSSGTWCRLNTSLTSCPTPWRGRS